MKIVMNAPTQGMLFGFAPEKQKKMTSRLVKKQAPNQDGWQLEPHVCSCCFGRIASITTDGATRYRCTNCGKDGIGNDSAVVCACGIKLHSMTEGKRVGPANRDAGIRCIKNPKQSPEFPSEYVAAYIGKGSKI